jgi:hypothetical protein
MFANPKFGAKKAPQFPTSFTFEVREEPYSTPYLKTYIVNDCDIPPKQLIAVDIYDIPSDAEGALKDKYDFIRGVSLLPEDAIRLVRRINRLLSELFKDKNYVTER